MAQRRSRGVVALGVRAAGTAVRPPVAAWRSELVAPVRRRVGHASAALSVSGRDTAGRVRSSAEVAAGYRARRAGERVLRSALLDEVVERVLSTGAFDRLVARVLDGHTVDGVTASAPASIQPAASRSS